MEIVHIVLGKANPNRMNGVNKVVHQLATRQAQSGRNCEVWGITADTTHNYPDRDFKTRLFKAYRNPFKIDPELRKAILDHPMVCYHIHGGWIPQFYSLSKLMKEHGIRYVLTPHGAYNHIAMERSYWLKKIYYTLFEKHLISNADQVHAIGASEINGLNKLGIAVKTQLIPYGFETNVKPTFRVNTNKPFVVGFLGRIDIKTKGLDLILDAFKSFTTIQPESELWFIGDGSDRAELEKMVAATGLSNVIIYGEKQGEEKNQLVSQMNVFIHASRNEGIPGAVLEASSAGIPVIITEATNLGDYYRAYDAGICIRNESSEDLFAAMMNVYQNVIHDKVTSTTNNAIRMISDQFSWNNLLIKYDQLYRA